MFSSKPVASLGKDRVERSRDVADAVDCSCVIQRASEELPLQASQCAVVGDGVKVLCPRGTWVHSCSTFPSFATLGRTLNLSESQCSLLGCEGDDSLSTVTLR